MKEINIKTICRGVKQDNFVYLDPLKMNKVKFIDNSKNIGRLEKLTPNRLKKILLYLLNYNLSNKNKRIFDDFIEGASKAENCGYSDSISEARKLIKNINDIDKDSINSLNQLLIYEKWFTDCFKTSDNKLYSNEKPDVIEDNDIQKIQIIFRRLYSFVSQYNMNIKNFNDFCISDRMLWIFDLKSTTTKIVNKNITLELLVYYVLFKNSFNIDTLGVYNPKRNIFYSISVNDIDEKIFDKIENDIIKRFNLNIIENIELPPKYMINPKKIIFDKERSNIKAYILKNYKDKYSIYLYSIIRKEYEKLDIVFDNKMDIIDKIKKERNIHFKWIAHILEEDEIKFIISYM